MQIWLQFLFTSAGVSCAESSYGINLGVRQSVIGSELYPNIEQAICQEPTFTSPERTVFNVLVIATALRPYSANAAQLESAQRAWGSSWASTPRVLTRRAAQARTRPPACATRWRPALGAPT